MTEDRVKDVKNLWLTIADRLSQPSSEIVTTKKSRTNEKTTKFGVSAQIPHLITIKVGHDFGRSNDETTSISAHKIVDIQNSCGDFLLRNNVIIVFDDFHYIGREQQTEIIRNLKSLVFNGLKVVFLSIPYKAYEAIHAETEIAGRFVPVNVPEWSEEHLAEIAIKGFKALNIDFPERIILLFAKEANGNPQLMQIFCWDACRELEIIETKRLRRVPNSWNPSKVLDRVAEDYGPSIYKRLAAGPQSRTPRNPRLLKNGGTVDIYEALLRAIAHTGPRKSLSYDEIKQSLFNVMADKPPQKEEVANALKHLTKIATEIAKDNRPLDWIEEERRLELPDPIFRFYLKWRMTKFND